MLLYFTNTFSSNNVNICIGKDPYKLDLRKFLKSSILEKISVNNGYYYYVYEVDGKYVTCGNNITFVDGICMNYFIIERNKFNKKFIELPDNDNNIKISECTSCTLESNNHKTNSHKKYLSKVQYLIDNGYTEALNTLGLYHYTFTKNYNEMKKYYLMAIEKGVISSMHNLANYYRFVEKNYDEMKKYYLMAIEKGFEHSMFELGIYYQYTEPNYSEMVKYYLMAVKTGNNDTNARNQYIEFHDNAISKMLKIK